MAKYQLTDNVFVSPTPAGAYFCISSTKDSASRKLMSTLLKEKSSVKLTIEALKEWTGLTEEEEALALLHRVQSFDWLEGLEEPKSVIDGSLEEILPDLLVGLSDTGKALLADEQGFYLSAQGFPHETAEELSALSADLFTLYQRHEGLLRNNLGLENSALAVVDGAGNSQIGFWPLWVGKHRFVLVLKGTSLLNKPALMQLIWALYIRYGS